MHFALQRTSCKKTRNDCSTLVPPAVIGWGQCARCAPVPFFCPSALMTRSHAYGVGTRSLFSLGPPRARSICPLLLSCFLLLSVPFHLNTLSTNTTIAAQNDVHPRPPSQVHRCHLHSRQDHHPLLHHGQGRCSRRVPCRNQGHEHLTLSHRVVSVSLPPLMALFQHSSVSPDLLIIHQP